MKKFAIAVALVSMLSLTTGCVGSLTAAVGSAVVLGFLGDALTKIVADNS